MGDSSFNLSMKIALKRRFFSVHYYALGRRFPGCEKAGLPAIFVRVSSWQDIMTQAGS